MFTASTRILRVTYSRNIPAGQTSSDDYIQVETTPSTWTGDTMRSDGSSVLTSDPLFYTPGFTPNLWVFEWDNALPILDAEGNPLDPLHEFVPLTLLP